MCDRHGALREKEVRSAVCEMSFIAPTMELFSRGDEEARVGPSSKLFLHFNTKKLSTIRARTHLNLFDCWADTSLHRLLPLKSSMVRWFLP